MSGVRQRLNDFSQNHGAVRMGGDYLEFLATIVRKDSSVLDAGCGTQGQYSTSPLNKKGLRSALIGMDLVGSPNPYVDEKHVGDLENLPFPDRTFDVVLCEWVAEHAEHPREMIKEFCRVLQPDGHMIFITVNKRNPLVLFGWLVPTAWKDLLLNRLLGQQEEDLFPLYMRFNDRATMAAIAAENGCIEMLFKTYPNPEYFRWSDIVLGAMLWLQEKTRSWPWLGRCDMYILAAFRKGAAASSA